MAAVAALYSCAAHRPTREQAIVRACQRVATAVIGTANLAEVLDDVLETCSADLGFSYPALALLEAHGKRTDGHLLFGRNLARFLRGCVAPSPRPPSTSFSGRRRTAISLPLYLPTACPAPHVASTISSVPALLPTSPPPYNIRCRSRQSRFPVSANSG